MSDDLHPAASLLVADAVPSATGCVPAPAPGEVPPAPGEVPPAVHAALEALADALDELGYRHLYRQGIAGDLFAADRRWTLRALAAWPAPERALLRMLALGADADARALPAPLASALPGLRAAGLVTDDGATVRADGWVVVPVLGGHLLTRLPPAYLPSGTADGRAYLGMDSLRLADALPPGRGRRVLDLGAGCGVQGLLAVPGAAEAALVDLEPDSVRLSAYNRVLNRVAHPVRVLQGDLYEPVAGEQFDLIVTLPPYVPTVEGDHQTGVTAGGPDGLALLRRIVAGASAHLAPGGELVTLCQLVCRGGVPLLVDELSALAPELDARIAVGEWHPLQPYLVELAGGLIRFGAADPGADRSHPQGATELAALVTRYAASLRPLGVTGVCTALVRLRRPRPGAGSPSVRVVGGRPLAADDVVAPAAGLTVGTDAALRTVGAAGVPPVVVDGPTAALLQAFDGRRTIAEAAVAAWGRLAGADPADVDDQAVHRTGQLERQGLALPVDGTLAEPVPDELGGGG